MNNVASVVLSASGGEGGGCLSQCFPRGDGSVHFKKWLRWSRAQTTAKSWREVAVGLFWMRKEVSS